MPQRALKGVFLPIFTDDHRLGDALTNADVHVPKTYEANVDRVPDGSELDALRDGIDIGRGETTRPAQVELQQAEIEGASLRITIDEGKNRQI